MYEVVQHWWNVSQLWKQKWFYTSFEYKAYNTEHIQMTTIKITTYGNFPGFRKTVTLRTWNEMFRERMSVLLSWSNDVYRSVLWTPLPWSNDAWQVYCAFLLVVASGCPKACRILSTFTESTTYILHKESSNTWWFRLLHSDLPYMKVLTNMTICIMIKLNYEVLLVLIGNYRYFSVSSSLGISLCFSWGIKESPILRCYLTIILETLRLLFEFYLSNTTNCSWHTIYVISQLLPAILRIPTSNEHFIISLKIIALLSNCTALCLS